MKNKFLLLLIFMSVGSMGFAQSFDRTVLASDGATSSTGTITLDWTLGELAISTLATQEGLMTQGFHQPMLTATKILTTNELEKYYQVQVMPNPVSSILTVDVQSEREEPLLVDFLDLSGKVIKRAKLEFPFDPVQFEVEQYPSGLYVIRVTTEEQKPIRFFKINKID